MLRTAPGCGTIAFFESDSPAESMADERYGDGPGVRSQWSDGASALDATVRRADRDPADVEAVVIVVELVLADG